MLSKFGRFASVGHLRIFTALLLVVIIMFVSNYLVYRNSISGIYEQVSENNRLVVKNVIRSFDDSFKHINDIMSSLNLLPYDPWGEHSGGALNMSDAYLLGQDIRTLLSSTCLDYCEEVVLFHNRHGLAVTSAGTIDLNELFRKQYRNMMYSADYWRAFAATKHPFKVFPAEPYTETDQYGQKSRNIIVAVGNNDLMDQNLMILINVDKLLNHVNQTAMMQGTSLIVMDQERNVILSTEKQWNLVEALNDLNVGAGSETTLKRKDYEYNIYKSDYNGFIYVHKVPYKFQNMKSVTEANRLIMGTTIVGAIILSAMLSFYLNRPIRRLLLLFGGRLAGWSDYRSIHSGIMKMQEENDSYKVQMGFLQSEIRRGVFLHALDEYSLSREFEMRMQPYFADLFMDRHFVMASFRLQPKGSGEKDAELRIDDLTEAIQAGLRDCWGQSLVFHEGGLRFLALIGVHQASDRRKAVEAVRACVARAKEGELSAYSLLAAVSRLYVSTLNNCHLAYRDLTECFVYRNVDAADFLIDYEKLRFTWKVYLPLDEIEKLSNCLLSGNVEETIRIIDDTVGQNAERGTHHHQLVPIAKCMFYSMLMPLDNGGPEQEDMIAMEKRFNLAIENAIDHRDIRAALVRAAADIARKHKSSLQTKLNPVFIAQYIDLNYMDNLHLDHMADLTGTSAKYFSNYFKKAFGVNFVDYLNKVRLSRAKELLKSTDWPVADIGGKTGYLNSSTFTSTFKKYFGISPSEYRKQSAGKRPHLEG